MPKRPTNRDDSEQGSEQLEDINAWGKRKDNYYQDSSNEYSELQQEQQEAQKIYQDRQQQLDNLDFYELPEPQEGIEEQEEEEAVEIDSQHVLSHAYLTKEIKQTAKLGLRISELPNSKVKTVLETQIQAYLMALIGLRELKIPFVEYHPILSKTIEMKEDISKLKRLIDSSTHHDQSSYQEVEQQHSFNQENQQEEQQQQSNSNPQLNENNQIQQGLKVYEKAKKHIESQKKMKKQQKNKEKQGRKKPAFVEVKGNEGRIASEKILKNKGLIKKRKKSDRNGRVKLRRKFDKATSKRRAHGHFIKQNPGRDYQGERNIKFGRIASVKIK